MLAGMAVGSLEVGQLADWIGRRRGYVALLILMALTATVFALTQWLRCPSWPR